MIAVWFQSLVNVRRLVRFDTKFRLTCVATTQRYIPSDKRTERHGTEQSKEEEAIVSSGNDSHSDTSLSESEQSLTVRKEQTNKKRNLKSSEVEESGSVSKKPKKAYVNKEAGMSRCVLIIVLN